MQALELALDKFAEVHEGNLPIKIVMTRAAIVALAAGSDFRVSSLRGVPVEIAEFVPSEAVAPGSGSRLGVFVNDSGVQLHVCAVDLS